MKKIRIFLVSCKRSMKDKVLLSNFLVSIVVSGGIMFFNVNVLPKVTVSAGLFLLFNMWMLFEIPTK